MVRADPVHMDRKGQKVGTALRPHFSEPAVMALPVHPENVYHSMKRPSIVHCHFRPR